MNLSSTLSEEIRRELRQLSRSIDRHVATIRKLARDGMLASAAAMVALALFTHPHGETRWATRPGPDLLHLLPYLPGQASSPQAVSGQHRDAQATVPSAGQPRPAQAVQPGVHGSPMCDRTGLRPTCRMT